MDLLSASHLAKSYKSRQVVRDVSLTVNSGQIVGLLGPNGAGKTTCFYMIVGLVNADKGRISINDQDLTGLPIFARARLGLGYLPQDSSIFRNLTVADNIMAILETRKELSAQQREEKLESLNLILRMPLLTIEQEKLILIYIMKQQEMLEMLNPVFLQTNKRVLIH